MSEPQHNNTHMGQFRTPSRDNTENSSAYSNDAAPNHPQARIPPLQAPPYYRPVGHSPQDLYPGYAPREARSDNSSGSHESQAPAAANPSQGQPSQSQLSNPSQSQNPGSNLHHLPVHGIPGNGQGYAVHGVSPHGQVLPGQGIQVAQTPQNLHHQHIHPNTQNTQNTQNPQNPQHLQTPQQPSPHTSNFVTRAAAALPRKRSSTACDTCRQKKSKCDNVRPRCGACVRSGNMNCRYRADFPGSDYSSYDPASLTILSKLDVILRHVKGDSESLPRTKVAYFQHCLWDMSLMSMFRWRAVQKVLGVSDNDQANWTRRLISKYDMKVSWGLPRKFKERFDTCTALEELLRSQISSFTNSFFLNAHTKVPCLDIISLLESIEIYTLMQKANPQTTFISMLEDYMSLEEGETVPQSFNDALLTLNLENTAVRRRAFINCCESVPLILAVCAIGIIASPVKLDNHQTFNNSTEEGRSMENSAATLAKSSPLIPKDRKKLSRSLIDYALIISSVFPLSLKRNSLVSIEYHIMLNQYHLYNMDPLSAHKAIVTASTDMMYYLEKEMNREATSEQLRYSFAERRSIVDRLFWTCLKLECELRAELSPHVPLSGITQMVPPSPFLRIPDAVSAEEHLADSVALTNKYDDKNSWYFFLTEVAVRKVDNKLYDEIYSVDAVREALWDSDEFVDRNIWKLSIKYLKQYDAIVASLSPRIRSFVLSEADVDEIHASMKRRACRKRGASEAFETDILDNLDEFFIDEDLLLKAQSESIMFIKTRFLASKIALFRPIMYLILEDRIPFSEIFEAAAAVLAQVKAEKREEVVMNHSHSPSQSNSTVSLNNDTLQLDTSSSSSQFANNFMDGEVAYIEAIKAPPKERSDMSEDNFNDIVEYDNSKDDTSPDFLNIKDYPAARKRVLQAFVKNLITVPKGNIPKIGSHRHSGSWYYVRQLIVGNISLFMLYKKVQQAIKMLVQNNAFSGGEEVMEALNLIFSRESIKGSLEHTLLMLHYWKEESPDCEIYIEQVQLCLDVL
ncbi:uncharacterized protein CXQ87_001491 [Candidozyma duobushaemuli]|uniref:Zn(2)-C6 fungal-type domain-containing protein n=2 Tax=Candidozyma TaxID=3303203 RepID=A0ABX8I1I1_9ASCO|nr:uncharacterized protein CXQ87_001491 [[Candida] duobushaemulonis]PVH18560.1 hypothetical protein CXQ87_001491 [[Candida] duobushaemulonis]QWU87081.1 hypothetical protein CA3LBN_001299 [[Candida] haemuloni]